jgi:SIR2-like domain
VKLPRPLVLLLGAGATRAAFEKQNLPPPLDTDFFEIAAQISGRGTRRLSKKVARDVFDLYGRVTGMGLEQYYRDIETRMEVSRFAKGKHRPKDWRARTEDLKELIRRVLIHTTCDLDATPAEPLRSGIHSDLLRQLHDGDSVITFNYDTVIEESMPKSSSLWTPRQGYGINTYGVTHDWPQKWFTVHKIEPQRKSKIQLLKLHGSLNWVLKASQIRLKPRPYLVRSRNGAPVFDDAEILPPGWHKRVDRNPYSTLWREARSRLEQCATLVIAGYSLPETDLIAKALFLEVARSRRARKSFIRELHVADVSDAAKKRIVDLFVPALESTGQVFRYGSAQELSKRFGSILGPSRP